MPNRPSHQKSSCRVGPSLLAAAALGLLGSDLRAEVVVNDIVPFDRTVTSSCLGEPVQFTGELHVLTTTQNTGNGTRISMHNQPAGVSGTGLITGSTYRAVGITGGQVFLDGAPPRDTSLINNFYIVGQGAAPNFLVHATIHVTVNADGTVTANTINTSVSCH